jgi:hypothetical protein
VTHEPSWSLVPYRRAVKPAVSIRQKLSLPGHMWISNESNFNTLFGRGKEGKKNVLTYH